MSSPVVEFPDGSLHGDLKLTVGEIKYALNTPNEYLGNISIAITDEAYITRSIKETIELIETKEEEIFILEKKLLTLNGLKRQMDKKNELSSK